MDTLELKFLVALGHFPKFGPARLKRIKAGFTSFEEAFLSTVGSLVQAGIEEKIAQEFVIWRTKINPDEIAEKMERENIQAVTPDDIQYPKLLKEIFDPPQLLYYKGNLSPANEFCLAVVGSRKFSSYGKQVAQKLVNELAKNNLTIVSGLALGIDTLAHMTAIEASGDTVAILGSGLDKQNIYPAQNRYLADKIISSGGAVVSEFPLGTPPLKHNFPQRNRIISGVSLATLVIEAGEKSGSLITASHALEQNREVFAVPGSIFSPYSTGPNQLIKLGAKVIRSAEDIIETLNLSQVTAYIENKKIVSDSEEEKIILSALGYEPIHIDEIIRLTKLDTSIINSTLVIMEMKGLIRNLGGMQYVIAR